MQNDLQNLKTRDAVLLMYLAGELSEADRAQVDHLLVSDPTFAGELDSLRATNDFCMDALADLDHQEHMGISESASVRNATRLIRQWSVKRQLIETPAVTAQRRAIPWARYGMSLAASLLIGFLIYSGGSFNGAAHPNHPDLALRPPIEPDPAQTEDVTQPNPMTDVAVNLSTDDQLALLTDTSNVTASDDSSAMRLTADLEFLADNNP